MTIGERPKATLEQLRTVYDIDDLFNMHDALDYEIAVQEAAANR